MTSERTTDERVRTEIQFEPRDEPDYQQAT